MNEYLAIGAVVAALTALLGLYSQFQRAIRASTGTAERRDIGPQPLSVKPAESFVPTALCDSKHQPIERRIERLENCYESLANETRASINGIKTEIHAGNTRIHERVDAVLTSLSELKGELKARKNGAPR